VAISLGGVAFTSVSNASIPVLSATLFDIGSRAASLWIASDVHWFACGTGTLTDADAAAIHAFGDTDKAPSQFPGACTMVWPCNSTGYFTPTRVTALSPGSLTLTPL
jgi:hypothetical protein